MTLWFAADAFSDEERKLLETYFTNADGPVFALINLPEVVKGALFARYSRSPKSLRRLFLDEFAESAEAGRPADIGVEHAEGIYERVFLEYGDDSVAQLGGVHLACEQSSQLLAKALEWGRLAGYLEQSTRYITYDDKPGGRWRYTAPAEVEASALAGEYRRVLDESFETYARWIGPMQEFLRTKFPRSESDSDFVYRSTIKAKACDTLRGMLPAATRSNVGIYASGQSYEQMLLRMYAHPLSEMHDYADMILAELRKVIPAFLTRVDVEDRGIAWSRYLAETRRDTSRIAEGLANETGGEDEPLVALTDFDPEAETKITAAALYAVSDIPDDALLDRVRGMSAQQRTDVLTAYIGDRRNRRHKPGRAFERAAYRFEVLCDYGAFRDLQRHRLLTLEWQRLGTRHGYETAPEIDDAGARSDWDRVMERSAGLEEAMLREGLADAAQYVVPMAYRIRFVMQMSAREAMHLIELRSSAQGHPSYRRVAHEMHRLIRDQAGHTALAAAMTFVDHSDVDLERLEAERRTEAKRKALRAR